MKRFLHIIVTPRGLVSRTLSIAQAFLGSLAQRYPECQVDEINLFEKKLPPLNAKGVDGKYTLLSGGTLSEEHLSEWDQIIKIIEEFLSYDGYLLSVPMWNFSIPYVLKHYIDIIMQPGYLFHYTENGPEGLIHGKCAIVITTRGADYSTDAMRAAYDHQERFLRAIFNFMGLNNLTFLHAQPMDAAGEKVRTAMLAEAIQAAKDIGGRL